MHYCDCKGTTKLQLLQRVFQRMLTIKEHKQIIAEMLPPGAIQDYETLYLLDKSTMYKLMNLLENTNSRKWLIYCIKIINRLK